MAKTPEYNYKPEGRAPNNVLGNPDFLIVKGTRQNPQTARREELKRIDEAIKELNRQDQPFWDGRGGM